MDELIISASGVFLLGIFSTIHPCPLATNLAAISMLMGWYKKNLRSLGTALFFISGYLFVFMGLSIILSSGLLSIPALNSFIRKVIPVFLGPFLILAGMLFADLLDLNRYYRGYLLEWINKQNWSGWYAFPMGMIIGMSFCPATAALFFGLLIPMAVDQEQVVLFPLFYAAGAALPLVIISFLIYRGSLLSLSRKWKARIPQIAGWVMIIIGIYLTIQGVFLS